MAMGCALGAATIGCSSGETRQLEPTSIAMTEDTAPFYNDGELALYQVSADVTLPVRNPSESERQALAQPIVPFDHTPWITPGKVGVQVTWTLANLDEDTHDVEVLVDPWNEFGRYVPGVAIVGDDAVPNLSGYDEIYELPGLGSGRPSRITHVLSYEDMDELATDFATVINIIQNGPMAAEDEEDDPRVGLVNHTFHVDNRSRKDPLTDTYIPDAIPALLGFQLSVRTSEPVNVAIEFVVEVVDKDGDRMLDEDSREPALSVPATTYTVGGG
jgi:hypothetical protein